ncbi:MAG: hypothetical protein ACPGRD_07985 [Planktomarina sp.]
MTINDGGVGDDMRARSSLTLTCATFMALAIVAASTIGVTAASGQRANNC